MRFTKLLSVVFCVISIATTVPAEAQDLSTPESTVRSFMAEFMAGNLENAAACIESNSYKSELKEMAQSLKKEHITYTVSELKTQIDGSSATVTISGSGTFSAIGVLPFLSVVKLQHSASGWHMLLSATAAAMTDGKDVVNSFAWMLSDPKTVLLARDRARAVNCLSNLKQLVLGVLMYLQDHNEKYPFSAAGYKKAIFVYIKSEKPFHCPADGTGVVSYSFNPHIAGISDAQIAEPAKVVSLYEGEAGKLNFKHEGKAGVAFADGHCKLVTEAEAKKLRWLP